MVSESLVERGRNTRVKVSDRYSSKLTNEKDLVKQSKIKRGEPRGKKFNNIGIRGRKTGIIAKANVKLDEDGMENVEDFFESDSDSEIITKDIEVTQEDTVDMDVVTSDASSHTTTALKPEYINTPSNVSTRKLRQTPLAEKSPFYDDESHPNSTPPSSRPITSTLRFTSKALRNVKEKLFTEVSPIFPNHDPLSSFEKKLHKSEKGKKIYLLSPLSSKKSTTQKQKKPKLQPQEVLNYRKFSDSEEVNVQENSKKMKDIEMSEEEPFHNNSLSPNIPESPSLAIINEDNSSEVGEELAQADMNDQNSFNESETVHVRKAKRSKRKRTTMPKSRKTKSSVNNSKKVPEVIEKENSVNKNEEQEDKMLKSNETPLSDNSEPEIKNPESKSKPIKREGKTGIRELASLKSNIYELSQLENDSEGIRRSKRQKISPLEFWRNERVVYKCSKVKEVIRVPTTPLDNIKRKTKKNILKKEYQPEINPTIVVREFETEEEVERNVVATDEHVMPRSVSNETYRFQKTFSEGDFMSSGILVIPKGGEKPNRSSKQSALIFYVISGIVEVTLHKTSFILASGGQFLIPRGNQYRIENKGKAESKLFFAQAREVIKEI